MVWPVVHTHKPKTAKNCSSCSAWRIWLQVHSHSGAIVPRRSALAPRYTFRSHGSLLFASRANFLYRRKALSRSIMESFNIRDYVGRGDTRPTRMSCRFVNYETQWFSVNHTACIRVRVHVTFISQRQCLFVSCSHWGLSVCHRL